jgi:mRNA-degrading endonuclease RelE of RelBE toxin-antitoxin system
MKWQVNLSKKTVKQIKKLPEAVKASLIILIRDIEEQGPVRGNWHPITADLVAIGTIAI